MLSRLVSVAEIVLSFLFYHVLQHSVKATNRKNFEEVGMQRSLPKHVDDVLIVSILESAL